MGILPFFGKELQSSCSAQSMASESLWDKADETGEYGKFWCHVCDAVFEGNNIAEVESKLNQHIWDNHPGEGNNDEDEDDDNNNNDSGNSGGSNGNGNGNSGYNIAVINIEHAATIAQQIGLDQKNNFINNYYCYGNGYIFGRVAHLLDFIDFITRKYGAISIISPSTLNNYIKYFILTSGSNIGDYCYYKIETNYSNIANSYYGIYVFR